MTPPTWLSGSGSANPSSRQPESPLPAGRHPCCEVAHSFVKVSHGVSNVVVKYRSTAGVHRGGVFWKWHKATEDAKTLWALVDLVPAARRAHDLESLAESLRGAPVGIVLEDWRNPRTGEVKPALRSHFASEAVGRDPAGSDLPPPDHFPDPVGHTSPLDKLAAHLLAGGSFRCDGVQSPQPGLAQSWSLSLQGGERIFLTAAVLPSVAPGEAAAAQQAASSANRAALPRSRTSSRSAALSR